MAKVLHVLGALAAGLDADQLARALTDDIVEVAPEDVTAHMWHQAGVVLVQDDTAMQLLRRQVTARRRGVLLIGHDPDDVEVYRRAIALGAEEVVFLPYEAHIAVALIHRTCDRHQTGGGSSSTNAVRAPSPHQPPDAPGPTGSPGLPRPLRLDQPDQLDQRSDRED